MSVVFTQDILNASLPPLEGWSLAQVIRVTQSPSKSDAAYMNHRLVFQCINGPGTTDENAGRTITYLVAEKGISSQVRNAIDNLVALFLAANPSCISKDLVGMSVPEIVSTCMGKKFYIEISSRLTESQALIREIIAFSAEPPF